MISGPPIDPFRSRWMLFVDGENLAISGKEVAEKVDTITLRAGDHYIEDVLLWLPGVQARHNLYSTETVRLDGEAIRAYYYTSVTGDGDKVDSVKEKLWALGFTPEVFKKSSRGQKTK